jgi:hypothetical protein
VGTRSIGANREEMSKSMIEGSCIRRSKKPKIPTTAAFFSTFESQLIRCINLKISESANILSLERGPENATV